MNIQVEICLARLLRADQEIPGLQEGGIHNYSI